MPEGVVPPAEGAAPAGAALRRTRRWPVPTAAAAATAGVLAAKTAEPHLPGAADYIGSLGIVPPWAAWAGAATGLVVALAATAELPGRAARPVLLSLGRAACVLLLWSAVGIVFDVFRAFFRVTGIPAGDFATVDWPGFLTRAAAFTATLLLARSTLALRRRTGEGCDLCGLRPGERDRPAGRLGYTAFGLAFVYPGVKYYWWAGGGIGRPGRYTEGFPVMETMLLVGGGVLSLALVSSWGLVHPSWVPFLAGRRVPRRLLLFCGWGLSAALLLQGLIPVFASVNHLLGGPDLPFDSGSANSWVILAVYGGWALFGLALLGATLAYGRRTRAVCRLCGE
ncbi:hypothetical protein ABZZ04_28790 [Streptomyces sp. NPDC006435]|uniref:hypothetical protein n=1 Tax=Streptomyces sp. NPDC006435 TaxID=3154300 RepID=UPI0033A33534